MRPLLIALALSFLAAAQAQTPPPPPDWTLTALNGDALDARLPAPTLSFVANRARGFSGCNRWAAGVTHADGGARFGIVVNGTLTCPTADAERLQNAFLAALALVRSTREENDQLILLGDRNRELMRFHRTAAAPE